MTNKDYKRLTFQHSRHGGMICGVGLKANSEEVAERLYALEEMIENGALMFLPKIGQTVWIVIGGWYENEYYTEVSEEVINEIHIYEDNEVRVSVEDGHGDIFSPDEWYTSKEAAENYAEKLRKFKERQQWKNSQL